MTISTNHHPYLRRAVGGTAQALRTPDDGVLPDRVIVAIATEELGRVLYTDPGGADFSVVHRRTLERVGDGAAPGRVLRLVKSVF